MKVFIKTVLLCLSCIFICSARAKDDLDYSEIDSDRLYIPVSDKLSGFNAQALSGPALSLYMVHAAQKYNQLLNDPSVNQVPLKDRFVRLYVQHPTNENDTLYQIDVRIYSPSYVGRRYNRMIVIRPYDKVKRPCILYTHGNSGNLNTWINYYMAGVTSMLDRGYAVAFYENYNNSFFTTNSKTDEVYRYWVHHNLADTTVSIADDHILQRGHFLLYQYAYAAHAYLTYIAPEYNLDEEMIFTAGHSAGGLSSLQLTFARPERNFRHPLFEFCGPYNSRKYPEIPDERIPVKGVLASAAGLQDDEIEGSYFGKYLDEGHSDKVAVMIHGAKDPLAKVDYGPALWANFVDTVKLMGPLTLHPRMTEAGIRNFSFINCIGQHSVYMYPNVPTDNSGIFRELSPFSYDPMSLSDEDFFSNQSLYQVRLFHQQMDKTMSNVSQIFSMVYHKKAIGIPSGIYTWKPAEYTNLVDNFQLNWTPVAFDCGIEGAKTEDFYLGEAVPVNEIRNEILKLRIYPNPANDILKVGGLNTKHQIFLYDIMGKMRRMDTVQSETLTIDTSRLENGIYFLTARDIVDNQIFQEKFIIQR